MKTVTKFITDDGQEFDNADDARAHEDAATFGALIGLTESDIAAALSRANATLADAFEKIGARIAKTRLEAGVRKRERKAKGEPALAATQEPVVDAPDVSEEQATQSAEELAAAERTEGLPI